MKASTKRTRRRIGWAAIALVLLLGGIAYAPSLLVFPLHVQVGDVTVYGEVPIDTAAITRILADADARVAASELAVPLGPRAIYLTQGGWRWTLLTLPMSRGAFALTRPFSTSIVVNESDVAADRVHNHAPVGNQRTLAGTIAHETTHLLINRRYGGLQARLFAGWRVEGYCDHVAQESSLTPDEAAQLRAHDAAPPALKYFDARKRIEDEAATGATADRLLHGD